MALRTIQDVPDAPAPKSEWLEAEEAEEWDFETVKFQVEEQQSEREGGEGGSGSEAGSRTRSTTTRPGAGTIIKDGKRYWRWTQTSTFPNVEEAMEAIKREGAWSTAYNYDTATGHKQYYRCKATKKCPALIYLMSTSRSAEVSQFWNNEEHAHEAVVTNRGIDERTKETIVQLMADGYTKPNQILTKLAEINIYLQKDKVKTFLRSLRTKAD